MSNSTSWSWTTVLVLRSSLDTYTHGGHIGPIVFRNLDESPESSWYSGACSPVVPGVINALAEDLGRRQGIHALVATLDTNTIEHWRSQLPSICATAHSALQDWSPVKTVVVTRVKSTTLENDILTLWPAVNILWTGAAKHNRPKKKLSIDA